MRFVVLFDHFYLIVLLQQGCLVDTRAIHHLHRSNNAILIIDPSECLTFGR
jgi:hypothetical protein